MTKRRISKASKRRLVVLGPLSLICILSFLFSLIYNVYNIYQLNKQKNNLERLYVQLQEEAENLKIDIEKLNDSGYLANYAREHYLYSKKDGEIKIQIDSSNVDEVENAILKDRDNLIYGINKNYFIIGLSVLMLFIFIYIIFKGIKSKK